jgi:hypothetical protein
MTISIHTPDPTMGALINALGGGLGGINQPDDNELMQAAAVRVMGQPLADWVAFIRNSVLFPSYLHDNTAPSFTLLARRFNYVAASGNTVASLPATGTNNYDTVEFGAYAIPNGQTIDVQRSNGQSVLIFEGGASGVSYGYCKIKRIGNQWLLTDASSDQPIVFGTPGI